ncbi:acyltransferase family protein, partial [Mycobacterium alsense]|uniref:acyltransferase family protein n=1 Tax=Mycobacterium alsense TaxID=324058 RepID=UPI001A96D893
VVLFHAHVPGLSGGLVGVDVFFIISGFLITGLLWREVNSTGTVGLRRFYGARARRLLPASATVGVAIMIGAAVVSPTLQSRTVFVDGVASALYVSNYRFALQGVDYLAVSGPPSPFQHYWSLGVEEQFYLVWPALIIGTTWLVRRVRRRAQADAPSLQRPYLVVLAIVGALSFAASLVLTQVLPPMAFFSLPTRAWELAAGGLVALTVGRWRRLPTWPAAAAGWAGLSLILLSCCYLSPNTPYPGSAALLPVLGTALVIGAGCAAPSQGCGRVLAISPMRAVGRVSYSWYLWHWPVLSIALWSFAPVMGHTLWLALAGILISLGFAVVTLRLIENPLRFANFARRSAMRSLALGGVATGVAVGVGIALQVPDPVGRGAPATALTVTAVDPPAGSDMNAYDVAVQHAFTQVQAAVAASAGLTAVPSNLEPPLAHAAFKGPLGGSKGCLRGLYQVGQPECA